MRVRRQSKNWRESTFQTFQIDDDDDDDDDENKKMRNFHIRKKTSPQKITKER